jgi:single-stranded DNA-binding protein
MRALISGVLHDAPTTKTSAKGKPFTICKIKDDSTNPATWASVVCFEEQAVTLDGMKKGDALSVSGKLTVDVYQPPRGEPRANISITCDSIITMKPVKKARPDSGKRANNQDNRGSGFDVNKFKGASGYSDKQAPPPPPDEGDPF